jgi:phage terminase large subunit-like protein
MKPERMPAPGTEILRRFGSLDQETRRTALALLPEIEREALDREWEMWAHRGQLEPPGDWATWVIKAGRGFGKTRAGAQWIESLIARHPDVPLRIALVGATMDDARRVMVEGTSGLLEVAGRWVSEWHATLGRLRFLTGAEAVLFSGACPHLLRGPDPVLKAIMDEPDTIVTGGPTRANPHLPPVWKARVERLYAGTRLGRQELDGELLADAAGALWTVELIERCRMESPSRLREGLGVGECGETDPPPTPPASGRGGFARTLIAVDPPSGDGTCGIIACAREGSGDTAIAHVLADHSVTGRSPEGWASAVAAAAAAHGTHEVVAEANQGGKMVKAVLHAADPSLRVRLVNAHTGKSARAEPVAHLFEAGRAVLHGRMPELEAQLLGMIAGGGYEGPGQSPDRADAMVWGVTELMRERAEVRVRVV